MRKSAAIIAAVLALSTASCQSQETKKNVLRVDFEDGSCGGYTANCGAATTDQAGLVIGGKKSLYVDTTKGDRVWNEFLFSPEGLFKPGSSYLVSFDYRWTEGKCEDAQLYSMLRSPRKNDADVPDMSLPSKMPDEFSGGMSGSVQKVFRIPADIPDYRLMLGVKDKGAVSIDNIEIKEVGPEFKLQIPRPQAKPAGPPPNGKWAPWPELSDEFDSNTLDSAKWMPRSSFWQGRPPAYFDPRNVEVAGGFLRLSIRDADYVNDPVLAEVKKRKPDFDKWTSATVESLHYFKYGYFEIRAKVANASCSSAFWFTGNYGTEIDVFEIGGNSPGMESLIHSTGHVFPKPWNNMQEAWAKSIATYDAGQRLADDYHTYGLEWDEKALTFYFDGNPIGRIRNTHWHFPIKLLFDIETMPKWLGVPRPDDKLPAFFEIDYFRAWQRVPSESDQKK